MSKAKAAVEAATFGALAAAIQGATVYQDVPADAGGDLVILGDIKSFRLQTKTSDDDRRVSISIVTLVTAEERAPLLALQDQIETALDGLEITTADGWTLAFAFEDDDAVLDEDGQTYTGVSAFTAIALRG